MYLILSDQEVCIENNRYLFYCINKQDPKDVLSMATKFILNSKITDIYLLLPFTDKRKYHDLAQLFYNSNINNVYKAEMSNGQLVNTQPVWNDKPILDYLEHEVTTKCNLQCKGCSHFINIHDFDDTVSIDSYKYDLDLLSHKYSNINLIRLLGGEPLISPHLSEYIMVSRNCFPNSEIQIATNGLLLKNMSTGLITTIKGANVKLDITLYPQFVNLKDEIIDFVKKNEIAYNINEIYKFKRFLSETRSSSTPIVDGKCLVNDCTYLESGRISRCPLPLTIYRLNERFGTKYSTDGYIDLTPTITGWEMNKFLGSTTELCHYCLIKPELFLFRQTKNRKNISVNEWVEQVKNNDYFTK